jgi:hypothetical protein
VTRWLAGVLALAAAMLLAAAAAAHEVRPALLQIEQTAADVYEVTWKRPILGDVALRLHPSLSSGWLEAPPADQFAGAGHLVTRWTIRSSEALDAQTLEVGGLRESLTDVLVSVALSDGRRVQAVLTPERPRTRLDLRRAAAPAAPAYLRLGVEHILGGVDHLLFVAGLLLLVGPSLRLVQAVTAFTAAHSVTLAAAALGWASAPAAVVEALVALVFVAAELARGPGADTLTRRRPWLVALLFGLLHGFAFAGALAEIGLPRGAAVEALFLFNVGVELGQLLFIAAAAAVLVAVGRLAQIAGAAPSPRWARLAPSYAIGALSASWFLERLGAVFA